MSERLSSTPPGVRLGPIALIADGAPREVIRNPAVVEAYLGQKYAQRSAGRG